MNSKKLNKKLVLNKRTVAHLMSNHMRSINGGGKTHLDTCFQCTIRPTQCGCPLSDPC